MTTASTEPETHKEAAPDSFRIYGAASSIRENTVAVHTYLYISILVLVE